MHEYLSTRKQIRLKDFDYSLPGLYYVTIISHKREPLFGDITNGVMNENNNGFLARACWNDLPNHYNVKLHDFVIMPNHFHGIIEIQDVGERLRPPANLGQEQDKDNGAAQHELAGGHRPSPTSRARKTLSMIIGSFKSYSSNRINLINDTIGSKTWQKSYHDHIIRGQEDMARIKEYIQNNPTNWDRDEFYK